MAQGVRGIRRRKSEHHREHQSGARNLRVISWNLLRLTGAGVKDVAALIARYQPDLLLMQEATEEVTSLPSIVGGHFRREPMHGRIYGLAAWSPHPLPSSQVLPLPVSPMPGRVPPRIAQIVRVGDITFANVHLSHGQILNRRQFFCIARSLEGPSAIIGDYNAIGPIKLAEFADIGPRQPTLLANNIISFRLDRCMARGLSCRAAQVLERGPSDHHPILLEMSVEPATVLAGAEQSVLERVRIHPATLRLNVSEWLRAISASSDRINVAQHPASGRKYRRGRKKPVRVPPAPQSEAERHLR